MKIEPSVVTFTNCVRISAVQFETNKYKWNISRTSVTHWISQIDKKIPLRSPHIRSKLHEMLALVSRSGIPWKSRDLRSPLSTTKNYLCEACWKERQWTPLKCFMKWYIYRLNNYPDRWISVKCFCTSFGKRLQPNSISTNRSE